MIRILFLADSHLGFDLPIRPRIERRRRGHDFLANYHAALAPAIAGDVDVVIHGGDVFDRPGVIATLGYQAFEPLRRIADRGIPVFVVPGNHERSRLPHLRFAAHPNIHVFDRPRTFVRETRGIRLAVAGFPYHRRDVRAAFPELLGGCEWDRSLGDLHLLCVHHCVEGATVGPGDYVFRSAPDVIRLADVPAGFAALLSGHIHRHQVLTTDLAARRLSAPVLYPGSIERTSLAEIGEPKGYLILTADGSSSLRWEFHRLPVREMVRREIQADGLSAASLDAAIRDVVASLPSDAVVSLRITGALGDAQRRVLSAGHLRELTPATMNLDLSLDEAIQARGASRAARAGRNPSPGKPEEPSLFAPLE